MARYVKCYRDFSGGLSEVANDNMADNQLLQAKNIVPGDGFGIARAHGVSLAFPRLPIEDINYRATEILQLTKLEGVTQTLIFASYPVDYQDMLRLDSSGTAWTTLATSLSPMKDFFIHSHMLYWLTGSALMLYDGVNMCALSITPAGSTPTSAELEVWNKVKAAVTVEQRGQRWFYGTKDNEVIFSEIGDPTRITPTNIININTKDNDSITAIKEFNNGLLIFKQRSVHYLSGWDFENGSDITLTRLNVTSGTVFPKTIKITENGVLYLGTNGVYRLHIPSYSSTVAATNISEKKIRRALFAEGDIGDAFAEVFDNVYYLTVGSDNLNLIREYRYYPVLDAFFGEYTQEASCYAVLSDNKFYRGLYNGYSVVDDESSYHYISAADGSEAAIPVSAASKGFDVAGSMVQDVKLKKALLAARQYLEEGSHLTVRLKADYADSQYELAVISLDESMVYGEGELGEIFWGWKDTVTKQIDVNKKAKRVSFYISDETIDEPLLLYGMALLYKKRKVKGAKSGVTCQSVAYDD